METKNNCPACNLPVKYRNSDDDISEVAYHKECTKCYSCRSPLESIMPCLFYKEHLYCDTTCVQCRDAYHGAWAGRRHGYGRIHCTLLTLGERCHRPSSPGYTTKDAPYELRCRKCMKILIGEDLVRKIANQYYHAHCFRCQTCNKLLITGQKYEIHRTKIFCATHMKRQTMPKRKSFNRTIINEVQRKILEKHFAKNKFPTMLETMKICSKTDLPHDAVRHWFQNNRARKNK